MEKQNNEISPGAKENILRCIESLNRSIEENDFKKTGKYIRSLNKEFRFWKKYKRLGGKK